MSAPNGWKLVPIEPTEAMHKAANKEWDGRMSARSAGVWEAMLNAAPAYVAPPMFAYRTCERHRGLPYTQTITVQAVAAAIEVCPICHPPAERNAEFSSPEKP